MNLEFRKWLMERPRILDGGGASELEQMGADLNHSLWSAKMLVNGLDLIREMHLRFLDAGAEMIVTTTYQASVPGFVQHGLSEEEAIAAMKAAVTTATQARAEWLEKHPDKSTRNIRVGLSLGPYGAYLANGAEYSGEYPPEVTDLVLREFHESRLRIFEEDLREGALDFIAWETIPTLVEARIVAELSKDFGCYLSLSLSSPDHLADGTPLKDMTGLWEEQVDALGVNCVRPSWVAPALANLKEVTSLPLIAYPNSGEAYDPVSKQWVEATGEHQPLGEAWDWMEHGAQVIGGCCRTRPKDIERLARGGKG